MPLQKRKILRVVLARLYVWKISSHCLGKVFQMETAHSLVYTVYILIYTVAPLLANFELWHEDILKTLLRGQSHEIRKSFIQKYHMG